VHDGDFVWGNDVGRKRSAGGGLNLTVSRQTPFEFGWYVCAMASCGTKKMVTFTIARVPNRTQNQNK
jgi:hypothetical protein